MKPGVWYANVHDPKFRFKIVVDAVAVIITQDTPPSKPFVWLQNVWGQWAQTPAKKAAVLAKATKAMQRFTQIKPTTKWFREHVNP